MIRLRPTVISLTMGEVKELERRRLFKRHLEKSMNIDPSHWRQDRPPEEPTPAQFTAVSTKADPEALSYGPEGLPRATSPASSVSSVNDEISCDEGLLPLRRSRRIQARHQVDTEAEERRSQLEANISGVQRRLQAIRLDPPPNSPVNDDFEEPRRPNLPVSATRDPRHPPNNNDGGFVDRGQLTVPAARAPRDPPNNQDGGFVERGQPHEQGLSGSSWMIIDEPSSRPSTPFHATVRAPRDPPNNHEGGFVDSGQPHEQGPPGPVLTMNDEPSSRPSTEFNPAAPSFQPGRPNQASASGTQPQSDGAQDTTTHGPRPRHREMISDSRPPASAPRPSSPGSPSSPTLPLTPSRFQIYNDSLPASSQPQTPQNLPEARHRSRMREFWTAPAGASSSRVAPIRTPATNRVRRLRGHRSPPGLQAPEGFMGLYGGTENIDDSVLFEQASRALDSEAGP
ncbi:hypothetical protein V8F06_003779 [Rhypophila decipiens]